MQYEVGKKYEMEELPHSCKKGFHYCKEMIDCFNYYNFDYNNRVAEVLDLGITKKDGK